MVTRLVFGLLLAAALAVPARSIKSGDVLEIRVPGNEALSQKVVVNEDGTIDYPLLSERSVNGLSVRELMDILTLAVAKADPAGMVVVNLLSEYKLKVNILGQVEKPGMVLVDKGTSLQEVLVQSGGINDFADLSTIRLIRKDRLSNEAQTVDVEAFLRTGDLSKLPEVQNGDTYIVLKAVRAKSIKVLGAVRSPGFYPLSPEANLFDMIQAAGGQQEDADLTKVRHITTVDGKRLDDVVDLRDFWEELAGTDRIPKVREGDMIIVYKKTVTWPVFMQYVRDAVSLFTVYLLIRNTN